MFQNNDKHLSFSSHSLENILIIYTRIVYVIENDMKTVPLSICYIITYVLLLVIMDGS